MIRDSLKIEAKIEAIEDGLESVVEALQTHGISSKICYKVRLALDELLTNIVSYAYRGRPGKVEICYEITDEPKSVAVMLIDEGEPFDPTKTEDPDITKDAAHREIGGLGLFIVKSIMDEVQYRREGNQNILVIRKNL